MFRIKPFHLGNESLDLAIVGVDLGRGGKISNYSVATLRGTCFAKAFHLFCFIKEAVVINFSYNSKHCSLHIIFELAVICGTFL